MTVEQLLFFLILQLTLKFLQITSKRNFRVILMMIYVFVYLLILCAVLLEIKEASSEVYRFREFCIYLMSLSNLLIWIRFIVSILKQSNTVAKANIASAVMLVLNFS